MAGQADFLPSSWEEGGTLTAFEAEADENGHLIPKVRVINPGWNTRKGSGYMYLILYGIIEEKIKKLNGKREFRTFAAFPLGVGRTTSTPDDLLDACLQLDITVRRTAGSNEKLVYGCANLPILLLPWREVIENGSIFPAMKVCCNVDLILLDVPQKFRPIFLTITKLTDAGYYQVPKTILDFRMQNGVSFNLLVYLKVGADMTGCGVKGIINDEGDKVVTFMLHIGNFQRRNGKQYSLEYCKQKVDRMQLYFSLGAIGGLSFHIYIKGKMSNVLKAQLGYKKNICYSLMDINPALNKVMWKAECQIDKVTAVFQPSVPKEFRFYDDVLIDNTGKILKEM
ncbi:matrix protein [Ruloma virus]|uniref:Matrix protein n=1 Tax=Ruloma virus TaxID=2811341 RepID=A0AAE7QBZ8_9MONO|nr:matrix protein [Ruloma virus]QRN45787.1 matrix protein [Ruloma virus]